MNLLAFLQLLVIGYLLRRRVPWVRHQAVTFRIVAFKPEASELRHLADFVECVELLAGLFFVVFEELKFPNAFGVSTSLSAWVESFASASGFPVKFVDTKNIKRLEFKKRVVVGVGSVEVLRLLQSDFRVGDEALLAAEVR